MDIQINVGSLPRGGIKLGMNIEKERFFIEELISNVGISLEIMKIGNSYEVKGLMKYGLSLTCSRCLREFSRFEEQNFLLEFKEKTESILERELRNELDEVERELLVVNNFINLGPFVHDEIILSIPMKPLCKEDCLGLCPICGVDLNFERCIHYKEKHDYFLI
ncbi:MAG: DUF177 domain-containing protein [candidate division WOR-3 bacterium]